MYVQVIIANSMHRQHPWFMLHLPRYLAVMQADTIASAATIDEDMVREVAKLGFDRDTIIRSIKAREQNKVRSSPSSSYPQPAKGLAFSSTGRYWHREDLLHAD